MQNAFKRAPAGPSAAEHNSLVEDWDSIKDEDKTLVHQVRLDCMLDVPMLFLASMHDLLDCSALFLTSIHHVLDCSLLLHS